MALRPGRLPALAAGLCAVVLAPPAAGLDADIAGFQGEGDGDPILQLAASLGRRGYFAGGDGARPFWFAGAGAGVLGLAGARTAYYINTVGIEAALRFGR